MNKKRGQQGSVLILALGVMAIGAAIAMALLSQQSLMVRKTTLLIIQDKLVAHMQSEEARSFARLMEYVSNEDSPHRVDSLNQSWALPHGPEEQEGFVVSGRVIDAQSLFNLNNLAFNSLASDDSAGDKEEDSDEEEEGSGQKYEGADWKKNPDNAYTPHAVLVRLLRFYLKDSPNADVLAEVDATSIDDWQDPEERMSDPSYALLNPPYRPAKRPFASVSELRLVGEIDPSLMENLSKSVVALPMERQEASADPVPSKKFSLIKVNVNTASEIVIAAILNIEPEKVSVLTAQRPYPTLDKWKASVAALGLDPSQIKAAGLWFDVRTAYFMIESKAVFNQYEMTSYTLVYNGQKGQLNTVYRMRGLY